MRQLLLSVADALFEADNLAGTRGAAVLQGGDRVLIGFDGAEAGKLRSGHPR